MKKILIIADYYDCRSGFGNVVNELSVGLEKAYTLFQLAPNYQGQEPYDHSRFKHVYPTDATQDPFGINRLSFVYQQVKPDLIFMLNDPWIINSYLKQLPEKDTPPIIAYSPIDGAPLNQAYTGIFKDARITHWFSYSKYSNQVTGMKHPVLYHGVNTDVFKPLSSMDRTKSKKLFGCPCNNFTVLAANAFSFRKCLPLTLRAVKTLHQAHRNVSLVLHVPPYSPSGMGPGEPNSLAAHILQAGWTQEHIEKHNLIITAHRQLSDQDLNKLYNAADCFISTNLGEGFGLTGLEALAAATPVVISNSTTAPELFTDSQSKPLARLIDCPVQTYCPFDNAVYRPLPSLEHTVQLLEEAYQEWRNNNKNKVINRAGAKHVKDNFQWEVPRKQLADKIREILK